MFILKIVVAVLFGAGFIGGIAKYVMSRSDYEESVKYHNAYNRDPNAEPPKKPSKMPIFMAVLSLIALMKHVCALDIDRKSSVSLNWLLDDECKIVKVE